jgi:hypothetical protein
MRYRDTERKLSQPTLAQRTTAAKFAVGARREDGTSIPYNKESLMNYRFAGLLVLFGVVVTGACSKSSMKPGVGAGGDDSSVSSTGGVENKASASAGSGGAGAAAGSSCDALYDGTWCGACIAELCCDVASACAGDEACSTCLDAFTSSCRDNAKYRALLGCMGDSCLEGCYPLRSTLAVGAPAVGDPINRFNGDCVVSLSYPGSHTDPANPALLCLKDVDCNICVREHYRGGEPDACYDISEYNSIIGDLDSFYTCGVIACYGQACESGNDCCEAMPCTGPVGTRVCRPLCGEYGDGCSHATDCCGIDTKCTNGVCD